jgi:hypothetical protein
MTMKYTLLATLIAAVIWLATIVLIALSGPVSVSLHERTLGQPYGR